MWLKLLLLALFAAVSSGQICRHCRCNYITGIARCESLPSAYDFTFDKGIYEVYVSACLGIKPPTGDPSRKVVCLVGEHEVCVEEGACACQDAPTMATSTTTTTTSAAGGGGDDFFTIIWQNARAPILSAVGVALGALTSAALVWLLKRVGVPVCPARSAAAAAGTQSARELVLSSALHVMAHDFTKFSRDQIKTIQETFQRFDMDGGDVLDFDELTRMMEKLDAPQTHLALKEMIQQVDGDWDGKTNLREFLLVFRKLVDESGILPAPLQPTVARVTPPRLVDAASGATLELRPPRPPLPVRAPLTSTTGDAPEMLLEPLDLATQASDVPPVAVTLEIGEGEET